MIGCWGVQEICRTPYGIKIALTALVVVLWGGEFHLWFGVFYFFVFSSLRSAIVYGRYRRDTVQGAA